MSKIDTQDSAQNIQQIIEKQQTTIEFVAFSGGGAKGAIYSGAYQELNRSGIWGDIKAIAGSSAGAITAAFAASGMSAEEFASISRETNLKGLLGSGTLKTNHDAQPLYDLLHDKIKSNVQKYLDANDMEAVCARRMQELKQERDTLQTPYDQASMEALSQAQKKYDKLQKFINNDGLGELGQRLKDSGKVCFKDIDMLSILDQAKFKGLIITATRKDNAELVLFNADNYPDVEIAAAARASASIPIIFTPMEIDGVKYVDGGCRDNVPQTYFDDPDRAKINIENGQKQLEEDGKNLQDISSEQGAGVAGQHKRVLAMVFGSSEKRQEGAAHIAVYSNKDQSPGFFQRFFDRVVRLVTRIGTKAEKGHQFKYSQDNARTYEQLRSNALNTVILDTKSVGTLSFDEAQKNAEYLHVKGVLLTRRHLANHDLGRQNDDNLQMKEFLLSIYEKTQFERGASWVERTDEKSAEKSAKLLAAVKDEAWQQNKPGEILKDFIMTAAMERKKGGNFSPDTKTMHILIKALNNPKMPAPVKDSFFVLLGKEKNIAALFDPKLQNNFSTKNFEAYIAENAPAISIAENQPSRQSKTALERLKEEGNITPGSPRAQRK